MDVELAALAASGATTLVSLMVTDSWTQVRELTTRLLSSTVPAVAADLDDARDRLLAADTGTSARTAQDMTAQWRDYLHHLLLTRRVTDEDLRGLLASLRQFDTSGPGPDVVRNDISGGVQHGPVIQAGHISRLTLHTRDHAPLTGPLDPPPSP